MTTSLPVTTTSSLDTSEDTKRPPIGGTAVEAVDLEDKRDDDRLTLLMRLPDETLGFGFGAMRMHEPDSALYRLAKRQAAADRKRDALANDTVTFDARVHDGRAMRIIHHYLETQTVLLPTDDVLLAVLMRHVAFFQLRGLQTRILAELQQHASMSTSAVRAVQFRPPAHESSSAQPSSAEPDGFVGPSKSLLLALQASADRARQLGVPSVSDVEGAPRLASFCCDSLTDRFGRTTKLSAEMDGIDTSIRMAEQHARAQFAEPDQDASAVVPVALFPFDDARDWTVADRKPRYPYCFTYPNRPLSVRPAINATQVLSELETPNEGKSTSRAEHKSDRGVDHPADRKADHKAGNKEEGKEERKEPWMRFFDASISTDLDTKRLESMVPPLPLTVGSLHEFELQFTALSHTVLEGFLGRKDCKVVVAGGAVVAAMQRWTPDGATPPESWRGLTESQWMTAIPRHGEKVSAKASAAKRVLLGLLMAKDPGLASLTDWTRRYDACHDDNVYHADDSPMSDDQLRLISLWGAWHHCSYDLHWPVPVSHTAAAAHHYAPSVQGFGAAVGSSPSSTTDGPRPNGPPLRGPYRLPVPVPLPGPPPGLLSNGPHAPRSHAPPTHAPPPLPPMPPSRGQAAGQATGRANRRVDDDDEEDDHDEEDHGEDRGGDERKHEQENQPENDDVVEPEHKADNHGPPPPPWIDGPQGHGPVLHMKPLSVTEGHDPLGHYRQTDIDLFLVTRDPDEATLELMALDAHIQAQFNVNIAISRTAHSVTWHLPRPFPKIQVILRLYHSTAHVLLGFDVDVCCMAYDGTRVLALPRAVRALQTRMNLVDTTRQSLSYEARLCKYAVRGFRIGLPVLGVDTMAGALDRYLKEQGLAQIEDARPPSHRGAALLVSYLIEQRHMFRSRRRGGLLLHHHHHQSDYQHEQSPHHPSRIDRETHRCFSNNIRVLLTSNGGASVVPQQVAFLQTLPHIQGRVDASDPSGKLERLFTGSYFSIDGSVPW